MGEISFWYFWTIWLRKKFENVILKKSKISGVTENGSISNDWIFRVANFGFNYLRHFSINFGNSCAYLAAIFLNFFNSPNIRKTPKNTCYSAPWLKSSLLNDTVHVGNTASLCIEIASSDLVPQHIWDDFKVNIISHTSLLSEIIPWIIFLECSGQQLEKL